MREHIGLATSACPVWEILYGALYVLKEATVACLLLRH